MSAAAVTEAQPKVPFKVAISSFFSKFIEWFDSPPIRISPSPSASCSSPKTPSLCIPEFQQLRIGSKSLPDFHARAQRVGGDGTARGECRKNSPAAYKRLTIGIEIGRKERSYSVCESLFIANPL